MRWTEISPRPRDIRIFAVVLMVMFVVAEWFFAGSWSGPVSWVVIALLLPGLIYPPLGLWAFRLWTLLGLAISRVVTPLLLTLCYYLLIFPFALYFKISGRDMLKRKIGSDNSYWESYDAHPMTLERYRKLF